MNGVPEPLRGRRVPIVMRSYPGKRRIYTWARELGARLVVLDGPGQWAQAAADDGLFEYFLQVDLRDDGRRLERALECVRASGLTFDGVATFEEFGVALAAGLASALGLPGHPCQAIELARNKHLSRLACQGTFFAVVGASSLVMQSVLTGRLMGRFGVRSMLLATPSALGVATVSMVLCATLFQAPTSLFWLAVVANLARCVLDAADTATLNVLCQPLEAIQRTRVQTVMDSVLYPLAIGLAGALLLLLRTILAFDTVQLASVLAVIVAAWLISALLLGRAYPRQLLRALGSGRISSKTPILADRSSITALRTALASPRPGVVVTALDLLEGVDPGTVLHALPGLLEHRTVEVRIDSLRRRQPTTTRHAGSLKDDVLNELQEQLARA